MDITPFVDVLGSSFIAKVLEFKIVDSNYFIFILGPMCDYVTSLSHSHTSVT